METKLVIIVKFQAQYRIAVQQHLKYLQAVLLPIVNADESSCLTVHKGA
jgi:hypothetical protein